MDILLAEIEYDGQLSAGAYIILTLMFFLIVGGLPWCFYRAMRATNQDAGEQVPDEE